MGGGGGNSSCPGPRGSRGSWGGILSPPVAARAGAGSLPADFTPCQGSAGTQEHPSRALNPQSCQREERGGFFYPRKKFPLIPEFSEQRPNQQRLCRESQKTRPLHNPRPAQRVSKPRLHKHPPFPAFEHPNSRTSEPWKAQAAPTTHISEQTALALPGTALPKPLLDTLLEKYENQASLYFPFSPCSAPIARTMPPENEFSLKLI